ncbi:MAG: helix-turn-helix domain protein [Herbinix sp.]|jgi:transcriptional regulator with XRE-family HTH domain|nr:helix-turn-helix domain protein [Herbinix sp.]
MNEFGKRLKMLRDERELPMSKLAEAVGTTKSALSRYENGAMEPGLSVLRKLAEYFGVTMDWLAGNGNIDDVQFSNKEKYISAINKCIKKDIAPEQLEQLIDIMKK